MRFCHKRYSGYLMVRSIWVRFSYWYPRTMWILDIFYYLCLLKVYYQFKMINNIMRKLLLAFCAFATICSAGAQWKPAGDKIKTEWADKVDPQNVLPEYPAADNGAPTMAKPKRPVGLRNNKEGRAPAENFRRQDTRALCDRIIAVGRRQNY